MIYESEIWRKSLLQSASKVRNFKELSRYYQRSFAIIEREVFVGFFSVRKLIEARTKVSNKCATSRFPILKYKNLRPMGNYQKDEYWEHFNLENPVSSDARIEHLANQFIHSLVFQFVFDDANEPTGFLIASDKAAKKFCYFVEIDVVAEIFEFVAQSYASQFLIKHEASGAKNLIPLN